MKEHHIEVIKSARYFTLGHPGDGIRDVWFVCHGYRQLASRFLRRFEGLADGTRLVVAAEGLSRFYVDPTPGRHGPEHRVGASWMTREDRETEIHDYVRYLDRVAEVTLTGLGPVAVTVLGFSQGVHTAARWVVLGAVRPVRLILWGADLPHDLDMEQTRRKLDGVELILVNGANDPTVDASVRRAQEEHLDAWGLVHRSLEYPGGHEIDGELVLSLARGEV